MTNGLIWVHLCNSTWTHTGCCLIMHLFACQKQVLSKGFDFNKASEECKSLFRRSKCRASMCCWLIMCWRLPSPKPMCSHQTQSEPANAGTAKKEPSLCDHSQKPERKSVLLVSTSFIKKDSLRASSAGIVNSYCRKPPLQSRCSF